MAIPIGCATEREMPCSKNNLKITRHRVQEKGLQTDPYFIVHDPTTLIETKFVIASVCHDVLDIHAGMFQCK